MHPHIHSYSLFLAGARTRTHATMQTATPPPCKELHPTQMCFNLLSQNEHSHPPSRRIPSRLPAAVSDDDQRRLFRPEFATELLVRRVGSVDGRPCPPPQQFSPPDTPFDGTEVKGSAALSSLYFALGCTGITNPNGWVVGSMGMWLGGGRE